MSAPGPDEDVPREDEEPRDLLRAAPGVARIAVAAWWQTARWTARVSAKAGSRALSAATSGMSAAELFRSSGADARSYARRLLGIVGAGTDGTDSAAPLRERGAELLRRSADVRFREDTHPAYERILGDLAPDEARILRLLAVDGPQPSVDVRTSRPLNIGSELVGSGISMIGAEAGCRFGERVPSYLNNLNRLGLIWFSREPVKERISYQVLEAQPDVIDAIRTTGRARTVRRSIHLTPFGEDFCAVCLAIDATEVGPSQHRGADHNEARDEEPELE